MQNTRPNVITTHHLERRAVVYVRSAGYSSTSVDQQVVQKDFAIGWGWPIDAINIIDDDGASGLYTSRAGYQQLIHMIKQGQVGLVLVADVSRLTRSTAQMKRFLSLCQSTGTLLAANGTIVARNENEQLIDQLRQCIAVFERQRRVRRRQAVNTTSNGNQS